MAFKIPVTCGLEKATAFICGLSILLPLQVTLVGSSYAVRRFGYGPETILPFLTLTYVFQEVWRLLGMACTTLMNAIIPMLYPRYCTYIIGTYSMVLAALITIADIRLLTLFGTSLGDSNMTMYYWTLSFAGFLFGAFEMTIRSISAPNNDVISLGMALGSILLTIFLTVVTNILSHMKAELSYWVLYYQLNFTIFLAFTSGIMWTIVVIFGKFGPESIKRRTLPHPQFIEVLKEGWPFSAMCTLTLGFQFSVFPLVTPFMIAPFETTQGILRFAVLLDALSASISTILTHWYGMKSHWRTRKPGYFWISALLIPFFILYLVFIHVMHYPEGKLGRMIYMKPGMVFLLTSFYYFSGRFIYHCGMGALHANISECRPTSVSGKDNVLWTYISGTGLAGLAILVSLMFFFDGYMSAFRGARQGASSGLTWPTEGMSIARAFLYWVSCGFKGGMTRFRDMWTMDIRQKILA